MKSLLFIVLAGMFLGISCNDEYVSNKRDGLKHFDADKETKEAQEEDPQK